MLIELLRRGADEAPDRPLVATPGRTVSYAACLERAEALAGGLRERQVERFACRVDDLAELVALLCGASATDAEACVYPDTADDERIARLKARLGHELIVRDTTELAGEPPAGRETSAGPLLVLTTGTTGEQKAARHEWRRLLAPLADRPAAPGERWLLAYNPSQFAGLQIVAHVLAVRATLVAGRSRQPRDAIAAMRSLAVTHASATPTFWRMVVSQLDEAAAQTLALEQITLGGEAVPEPLIGQLERLFPHARVSQVYASTEFGSAVSVRDRRSGLPLSVLDRSDDAPVQFRIVDGELQARSRIGMLGYHGEEATVGGWRPTGDLVEVSGERIHFVGRTTDTINVGGVKVAPLPVEEAVSAVDGVALVRAYGRPNPVTGEIVAVDVVSREGVDRDRLDADIRRASERLPPASRPRRIRYVDTLELSGDKVSRRG